MRQVNRTFGALGTSVFETMSRLARQHEAINLGQGFPDDRGAPDVLAKAAEALLTGWNQYPPMHKIAQRFPDERVAVIGVAQCPSPIQRQAGQRIKMA